MLGRCQGGSHVCGRHLRPSMGNFNITHGDDGEFLVRNTGHLRHEGRQQQDSEDRFLFPECHRVIMLAFGRQERCPPLAEKSLMDRGEIAPSRTSRSLLRNNQIAQQLNFVERFNMGSTQSDFRRGRNSWSMHAFQRRYRWTCSSSSSPGTGTAIVHPGVESWAISAARHHGL